MTTPNATQARERLDDIIAESTLRASRAGYFAALYRGVTARVEELIPQGHFDDGPRMDRMVGLFADRYFHAYDGWRQGLEVMAPWRHAFGELERDGLTLLQHLMLGMNAHINLDLGISTVEAVGSQPLAGFRRDFDRINDLLAARLDGVQDAIGEVSPVFELIDGIGGEADEAIANFSLVKARDYAWNFANALDGLPAGTARLVYIQNMALGVRWLGRTVSAPPAPLSWVLRAAAAMETTPVPAVIARLAAVP